MLPVPQTFHPDDIKQEIARRRNQELQRNPHGGLLEFIRYFWHVLEPVTPFVEGWALEAMCQHLEAVTAGEVTRLLINVPPGFSKSLTVNVFWGAWQWGPMGKSHLRTVSFSYSPDLTERDNGKFVTLVKSDAFQDLWGDCFGLKKDGERKVTNDKSGSRFASSIGGVGTGERGDIVVLDDPHNVKDITSALKIAEASRWFRESMSNRLNDVARSAIVVIMQRLHEEDVSGLILSNDFGYCHLMIPMEFDPAFYAVEDGEVVCEGNDIGWIDPRALDEDGCLLSPADLDGRAGMLAWAERYPEQELEKLKPLLGPYGWSGQYQQSPVPREGAIFDLDCWQVWESPKFPTMDFIVASLDPAFTKKEQNDPSGFTVWGVWHDEGLSRDVMEGIIARSASLDRAALEIELEGRSQAPKLMLMAAWRKHLQIHGPEVRKKPGESDLAWMQRSSKGWGICEWAAYTCRKFNVDVLLVEAKASGIDVINEMRRLYGGEGFGIEAVQVSKDKVARAIAVQPVLTQGIVHSPDREWAELVKNEMIVFPRGRFKDLTDSTTQAWRWLRTKGLIQRPEELARQLKNASTHRPKLGALYVA